MNSQTAVMKQTVQCVFCRHENDAWRSQCEKCGEALNRGDGTVATIAATTDQRTLYERLTWRSERAERVYRWLLVVGALLFLMRLLERCTADTQPDIPPLFSSNETYVASDYHPRENDHAGDNDFVFVSSTDSDFIFTTASAQSATEIFATQTFTIVHPVAWQVEKSDATAVMLTGDEESFIIRWVDRSDTQALWKAKQEKSAEFYTMDIEKKQHLRTALHKLGEVIDFSEYEPEQLRGLPIVFGPYRSHIMVGRTLTEYVEFTTACAEERMCVFIYFHMREQPITPKQWVIIAQIVRSLQFVDDSSPDNLTNQAKPIEETALKNTGS